MNIICQHSGVSAILALCHDLLPYLLTYIAKQQQEQDKANGSYKGLSNIISNTCRKKDK